MTVYKGCCKREKRKIVHWVEDIVCRTPAPLPCGVSPIEACATTEDCCTSTEECSTTTTTTTDTNTCCDPCCSDDYRTLEILS